MTYALRYHARAADEDLRRIAPAARVRIGRAIAEKLALDPERYDVPLGGSLRGYWKFRVGDYRVVFRVDGSTLWILAIVHRKDAYERAARRSERA